VKIILVMSGAWHAGEGGQTWREEKAAWNEEEEMKKADEKNGEEMGRRKKKKEMAVYMPLTWERKSIWYGTGLKIGKKKEERRAM